MVLYLFLILLGVQVVGDGFQLLVDMLHLALCGLGSLSQQCLMSYARVRHTHTHHRTHTHTHTRTSTKW